MKATRVLFMMLFLTSAALLVSAEEPLDPDDVDRTDFTESYLQEDKKILDPVAPHSEVEPAAMLPDSVDGKTFIGVPNYLLVALANSGSKMFNVSKISGVLSGPDGKEQKLAARIYGEPLGPREQRSFRFGFTPDEKTAPGKYNMAFQVFYNDRNKDQFLDTVFNETTTLAPAPPVPMATKKVVQISMGGGLVLLVLIILSSCFSGGGKGKASSSSESKAGKAAKRASGDEWLSDTLAGTEAAASGLKKGKQKRG